MALVRRNAARYFYGTRRVNRVLTQATPYSVTESNAPTLWAMTESGESDGGIRGGLVRIAIIDTGCNAHDDLPTPLAEENFVNLGYPAEDSTGHGTAVAGIALARDNELCYIGAAPDADLVVARIDPELGGTSIDRSIAAITWAWKLELPDEMEDPQMSVRVINMSYGSEVDDLDEELVCNAALAEGVILVGAAGNIEGCSLSPASYPAGYASVLCVGSVDTGGLRLDDPLTDSRRYAAIDLTAGGMTIPVLSSTGATACGSEVAGTSFASPVVAGVAALLFDQIETDSTTERKPEFAFLVRQALLVGASDGVGGHCSDGAGRDPSYGWGRVDAEGSHLIIARRLACKPDFNLDGVLDSDDLDEFTVAASNPLVAGPGGYAVPQVIRQLLSTDDVPDEPYAELGYAADYNQDGKVDTDDVTDFVADYCYGC